MKYSKSICLVTFLFIFISSACSPLDYIKNVTAKREALFRSEITAYREFLRRKTTKTQDVRAFSQGTLWHIQGDLGEAIHDDYSPPSDAEFRLYWKSCDVYMKLMDIIEVEQTFRDDGIAEVRTGEDQFDYFKMRGLQPDCANEQCRFTYEIAMPQALKLLEQKLDEYESKLNNAAASW